MSVNDYIGPNEEVKFIGTYNINNIVSNPGNNDYSGADGLITDVAGVCGLSQISNTYVYTTTQLVGSPRFLFENYALTSVDDNKGFLGNCIWQGALQDTGSFGFTDTPIFAFPVSGTSGIYSGIIRVVINFTNENRVLYFIGLKV